MKRILSILLLALLGISPAFADVWQARYGVAETFNFKLYNADGTLDVDEADGGTEVSVSCNEGAETTATNDFVDEGTFYSIALTAAELQCERVAVVVAATTTEVFFIQTSGNASAMTPTYEANVASVTADAITASAIATDAIGAAEIAASAIGASEIADGGITSTEFGTGAITATVIAADAIGASELAADAIGASEIAAGAIAEDAYDTTAGSFKPLGIIDQGTAQSATATTVVLRSAAAFGDDTILGATIVACGSTQGYCQSGVITDYVNSTDTATVATWGVTPSGTVTYYVFGTAPSSGGGGGLDAAGVRAAIGLASANLDTQLTAIDDYVDTEVAAILDDTGTSGVQIPAGEIVAATFGAGAIDAAAIATDAIGAAEIAASAIGASEIADGGITSTEFGTGAITATVIAADAIGASELAADAIGASEIAAGAIAEDAYDTTAGSFKPLGIIDQGTAQSATATTVVLRSAAAFGDDTILGATIVACGSTQGYCQSGVITDYVNSTDTATVATWGVTPSGTVTYYVFGTAPSSGGGGGLDAAGVRAAIGLASANLDTQLTAIDDYVDTEVAAILDDTGTSGVQIPAGEIVAATFGAGAIDAAAIATDAIGAAEIAADAIGASELAANSITSSEVADNAIDAGALAADALTAAKVAADVTTELQSGLATAASLSTVAGYVDTEVAAIKAKTDSLTFTVGGQVDANAESMNGAAILGTGTSLDKWRGE